MDPVIIPVVAIVFSLSIPIVAIIIDYFTKKNKNRIIEKAIEKGVTLDGLSLEDKKGPRMPYRAGMIALAIGIGMGILGVLLGQEEREALYAVVGAGSIPALIGIALIINDRINYDRYFNKKPDEQ